MRLIFSRSLILAATVLLAACLPTTARVAPETTHLTWPPEPEPARVSYVRSFSRAEDLGISRGIFERVKDLIFGEAEQRLVRPMAVAVVDGVIYVADPGAHGVHRFDSKGQGYALIGAPQGAPLPSPVGLARGAAGEVYVADSALARIFVIRPGAKAAEPVALQATLHQPTGLAYDATSGRLFVTDTTAHDIKVFNRAGALENTIGKRGTAPGEFNFPTLLWRTPQGHLHVTDSLNFRVQTLDEKGHVLGSFGRQGDGGGDSSRPKGIATDRYEHLYVVDSLFHSVQIFDTAGRYLLSIGGRGRGPGEFWLPTGIFIDSDDTIYIADSYNRRVQVLRYVGGAA
jgi:hypothetical protein